MSFVHLVMHSRFSLQRGVASPAALCEAARARGYASVALTDTNGLYGLHPFLEACRDTGLSPIVGVELRTRDVRAVLLVRDRKTGYPALCRAISAYHRAARPLENSLMGTPPADDTFDLAAHLAADHSGLAVLSDSPALLRALRAPLGPDRLFVELRTGHRTFAALRLAEDLALSPVASCDAWLLHPADHPTHRLLRAIDLDVSLSRVPAAELCPPDAWLMPPDALARAFRHAPEAIENASRLAETLHRDWRFDTLVFPTFPVPPDHTSAAAYLRVLSERGVRERYGGVSEKARARLARELTLIESKGFADYFLVVWDIVTRFPRTCGRGSAAASLVAYALGITHVDPIRYDLFFERFLNEGRKDPPDIDVDFPWDERDAVLEYVFRRYGPERTAMISNHNTFQPRAAIREVAKVHGMPEHEIKEVTERFPWHWDEVDLGDMVRTHPTSKLALPVFAGADLRAPWPEILSAAQRILGFPRLLSTHCGGVVIAPGPITDWVPVEPAAKGVHVVQWEKEASEAFGLVKLDLLGNRSLAVIRDACARLRRDAGIEIDDARFAPLEDPATVALLAEGRTMGVFYVESPAMRQLQQKTGRGDFEHLVLHSSIIRPAANRFIREYVRRLRGEPYDPLPAVLEEVLRESYGIMSYQEDVSRVAMAMAGFDAAEADGLRKILSKKDPRRKLEDARQRFEEGSRARGFADEVIAKVWEMVESFRGYSFCKPHSASYALVSFRSAWLRAHHPAEFMAGVISNQGGYYSTFAYVSEARRMGLEVLPPDANESEKAWSGRTVRGAEGEERRARSEERGARSEERVAKGEERGAKGEERGAKGEERRAKGEERRAKGEERGANSEDPAVAPLPSPLAPRPWIRCGLMQVKGLKAAALDRLLAARARDGAFASFEEFLRRVDPDPADAAALVRAGAFDRMGGAGLALRPKLLWRLDAWRGARPRGANLELFPSEVALPPARPYDEGQVLAQEVDSLGFLLSRHPLSLYESQLARVRHVPAREMARHVGRRVTMIGWWVTGKVVQTKAGEPMEFVSFEDTTEIYEATFFPEAYARFCHLLTRARPFVLRGKIEEDLGAVSIVVEAVSLMESHP